MGRYGVLKVFLHGLDVFQKDGVKQEGLISGFTKEKWDIEELMFSIWGYVLVVCFEGGKLFCSGILHCRLEVGGINSFHMSLTSLLGSKIRYP